MHSSLPLLPISHAHHAQPTLCRLAKASGHTRAHCVTTALWMEPVLGGDEARTPAMRGRTESVGGACRRRRAALRAQPCLAACTAAGREDAAEDAACAICDDFFRCTALARREGVATYWITIAIYLNPVSTTDEDRHLGPTEICDVQMKEMMNGHDCMQTINLFTNSCSLRASNYGIISGEH
eukprot:3513380-Pleurochrysis_carterae.AAC.2